MPPSSHILCTSSEKQYFIETMTFKTRSSTVQADDTLIRHMRRRHAPWITVVTAEQGIQAGERFVYTIRRIVDTN